jgi:acyl dehydratase
MGNRTLTRSPSILPLYARAAAPMIPGASLLPFVPGGGREIPDLELTLPDVRSDPDAVADYAKVCGFSLRGALPATYPHVLAFPLHMAVMADGSFPFGAVGLVHVENRIVQHRPIAIDERITLRVRPTKLEPHPRGRTFAIVTEAHVGGERVWEGVSTMLRRGGGSDPGAKPDRGRSPNGDDGLGEAASEWKLGGDLGRRYASVSGDRNPIHMHSLIAKPLGFPRAIAHGMWTKARCLAALESKLPDAFAVDVSFRRPVLLPGKVAFASQPDGDGIGFAVRDASNGAPHLDGRVQPLEAKAKAKTGRKKGS